MGPTGLLISKISTDFDFHPISDKTTLMSSLSEAEKVSSTPKDNNSDIKADLPSLPFIEP